MLHDAHQSNCVHLAARHLQPAKGPDLPGSRTPSTIRCAEANAHMKPMKPLQRADSATVPTAGPHKHVSIGTPGPRDQTERLASGSDLGACRP